MKQAHARCVRTLIALLVILQTSALLAQSVSLAASSQASLDEGQRQPVRWIEEWDPQSQRWVRVEAETGSAWASYRGGSDARNTTAAASIARFGPFQVVSDTVATLVGSTDSLTPDQFLGMMDRFPNLQTISFIDAPGTVNDIANLKLGRLIRARGLATHIPSGGSARSGAVELFLAGTRRTMDSGALFAVHSWLDSSGREPGDYPENDPANRLYIDYYVDMGMSEVEAHAFYAMTNSVPHSRALWFGPDQMRRWVGRDSDTRGMIAKLQRVTIAYRFDHMFDGRLAWGG